MPFERQRPSILDLGLWYRKKSTKMTPRTITLSILRKLKYLAKYELRKQLAETLILSKIDYADLVFYPLPQFLLHRLQRVQFAAASFVLGHYIKNFRDVLKIRWLPIHERRDLKLLKSCFKALHNAETWPDYLKIIKQECPKTALYKIMRQNYLIIYQKLLETVKITELFWDSQRIFFKKQSTKQLASLTAIGIH